MRFSVNRDELFGTRDDISLEEGIGCPRFHSCDDEARLRKEKGYDAGKVDGRADNMSRAAIRAFQKDEGIPITGMIDEKTADRLGLQRSSHDASVDRSAPLEQRSYR